MSARAFRVTGRVQGVSFRAGCQRLAARTGVNGWVRNVGDGAVEGRVSGADDAVAAFLDGLTDASPHGQVDSVRVRAVSDAGGSGFDVRPTVPAPTDDWPPQG